MSDRQASRELDALVAGKVMGARFDGDTETDGRRCWPIPPYSTSIAAAWTVVEKLVANDKFVLSLENHRYDTLASAEWMVRWMWTDKDHGQWNEVEADTAPLAICLAALEAIGYE